MNRFIYLAFVTLFLTSFVAGATTVERINLVPRQAGFFTVGVRSAYNSATGETLVIWDRNNGTVENHSLWGHRIDADGNPVGNPFKVAKGSNVQSADIAYSPDTNQFVVVYSTETNGAGRFELYAKRLKPTGKKLGKAVRISPEEDEGRAITSTGARIIYDADAQGFIVIWNRDAVVTGVDVESGLYGTVLNTDLTVRTAPALMSPLQGDITNRLGPNVTDLGFHPNGKLLIAGWSRSTEVGFTLQYFLARIDPTLKKPKLKLTKMKKELSSGAAPYAEVALLPAGESEGLYVEGTGVKKRRVNGKGAPSGPEGLFFTGAVATVPLEFSVSTLATDGDRQETAVLGVDDSSTQSGSLWLQTADASGNAIGAPFQLQSGIDIGFRPEIFPLPNHPSSGFHYVVVYTEGVNTGTPAASSGLVLLKVNTTP